MAALAAYWLGLALVRFGGQYLPLPPAWAWWGLAGLTGLAVPILAQTRPRSRLALPLAVFLCLGLAAMTAHQSVINLAASDRIAGQRRLIQGWVADGPDDRPWGSYYVIDGLATAPAGRPGQGLGPTAGRLRLKIDARIPHPPRLTPGDRVRFIAWVNRATDFANGQPFSYRRYLADRGIAFRATVSSAEAVMVVGPPTGSRWRRGLARVRQSARGVIDRSLPPDQAALVRAVLLGDRGGLNPAVSQAFQATGTAHLLVVSGLHLALVAGLSLWLVRFLLTRSTRLCLRYDLIRLSRWLALIPVAAYALLAGLGPPTARALILVASAVAARAFYRRPDSLSGLTLAGLVLSLIWPPAPFDLGFQMSFGAVLALIIVFDRPSGRFKAADLRSDRGNWALGLGRAVGGLLLVSLAVNLALAPLLIRAFNQVPAAGILLNAILVPLIAGLAVPLGLAGLALAAIWPPLGLPGLIGSGLTAVAAAKLTQSAAGVTGISLHLPTLNLLEVGLAYLGLVGLAVVIFSPRSRRRLGLALLGLALVGGLADYGYWHFRLTGPETRLTAFDVGRGQSLLLEAGGGVRWLIDGGGQGSLDYGRMVIGPALAVRKVTSLRTVVLTHPHPDHYSGLNWLVDVCHPKQFIYPGHPGRAPDLIGLLAKTARLERTGLARLHQGLKVGPVAVTALWPPVDFLTRPDRPAWWGDANESSLVLMLDRGGQRILIGADIERRAEAELVRQHDAGLIDLRAEVLIVPHHGGRTSSTPEFLDRVRPRLAIISTGGLGRYAGPAQDTLARLRAVVAKIYRTDRQGAVTVTLDGTEIKVTTVR